jgi:hypothetical protein
MGKNRCFEILGKMIRGCRRAALVDPRILPNAALSMPAPWGRDAGNLRGTIP